MNYGEVFIFWCLAMMGVWAFGMVFRELQEKGENMETKRYESSRHCYPIFTRESFQSDQEYEDYYNRWFERARKQDKTQLTQIQEWKDQRYIHLTMRLACIIAMFIIVGGFMRFMLYQYGA